jgi:DNA-binding transcriptional LysR family regulator
MKDLDISALRAFLAVVDERGFTKAAARLNRTQSAISMQIRRLEENLDVKLFANSRRADLTREGERLLTHARRIVSLNDETIARTFGADVTGYVRIGTPDDYAASMLPMVLRRLASTHPQVEVEVQCSLSVDLIKAVDRQQLDLAIITRPPQLERGVTVRREPLQWVASSADLSLRRPLPMALFSRGCLFRDRVRSVLDDAGLPWRRAYQSVSLSSLLAAVSEGLAIAVFARTSVPAGLTILNAQHGMPPLGDVDIAVYSGQSMVLTPAAQAVQDSVVAALSNKTIEQQRLAA